MTCCLLMLQGHLLWLATYHQHPAVEFAAGTSPAIHQGNLQSRPALAGELSCGLCQMVRQNLALPVAGSLVLYFAPLVSRLLFFHARDYRSCEPIAPRGRAPPLS